MESMLLALALTVCTESPKNCTSVDTDQGKVVTVCNVAPDIEQSEAHLNATINNEKHIFVLKSRCELF